MEQFILTHEQFKKYQEGYLKKAHTKTLKSHDIVLYNIIRGKDPRRGFTPITNHNKLTFSSLDKWHGYINACEGIRWATRPKSPFIRTRSPSCIDLPEFPAVRYCDVNNLEFSETLVEHIREKISDY